MKKIKKILLSLLLFSFVYVVVHDFAMAQVSSPHTHEFVSSSLLTESQCVMLSMESQVHESVHTMISSDLAILSISALILDNKPLDIEISFSTHDSFVLERPPLS